MKKGGKKRTSPSQLFIALATLCAGLAATSCLWRFALADAYRQAEMRFDFRMQQIEFAIQQRMLAYEQVLRGAVGLFAASDSVSREEWHDYLTKLDLAENYPGIQGIGVAEHVFAADQTSHIERIRGEGFPEYTIHPPGERAEYAPVIYLEPFDAQNQRAFGYDMFSEPVRRTAMERARDTAETALSGKVFLIQERKPDVQPGFLMYAPVYRNGMPTGTEEQRRTALAAYVYSPFRARNLMRGILGQGQADIDLEIFDGPGMSGESLLYKDTPAGKQTSGNPLFVKTATININGQPWTLRVTSLPEFHATVDTAQATLILVTGLIISVLISVVISSLATTRRLNTELELRVSERTEELHREISERRKAEEEVRLLNDQLEHRVIERTEELEVLHKQLVSASRQAGMAEVATNVLHNVGNVLNSVNVSCSVISEQVRNSRIKSVAKAADLMRAHADDIGAFLTSDPAGQKLPPFLEKLGSKLSEEQNSILTELRLLEQNIEHIKDIIAVQQNHAHGGGVRETLPISELVDDAIRMNESGLARNNIRVIRHYEEVPPVSMEKHKVLQILVNLVNNARYALSHCEHSERQLVVRVAKNSRERVAVSVQDNGVGIPYENLTRIFAHGFTTRKDGHGFGLHSGVLAAQQMGGSLTAHSNGVGLGATFTLELPVDQGNGNGS